MCVIACLCVCATFYTPSLLPSQSQLCRLTPIGSCYVSGHLHDFHRITRVPSWIQSYNWISGLPLYNWTKINESVLIIHLRHTSRVTPLLLVFALSPNYINITYYYLPLSLCQVQDGHPGIWASSSVSAVPVSIETWGSTSPRSSLSIWTSGRRNRSRSEVTPQSQTSRWEHLLRVNVCHTAHVFNKVLMWYSTQWRVSRIIDLEWMARIYNIQPKAHKHIYFKVWYVSVTYSVFIG